MKKYVISLAMVNTTVSIRAVILSLSKDLSNNS